MEGDETLAARLDALGEKIDGLTDALHQETVARTSENEDIKTLFRGRTRNAWLGLAALAVGLFAVFGGLFYSIAESNRRCDQIQRNADAIGKILDLSATSPTPRTPERQAQVDEFLATARGYLDEAREC